MSHQGQHRKPLNSPEENDETQSEEFQSGFILAQMTSLYNSIALRREVEGQTFSHQHNSMRPRLTQSWLNLIQHDQLPSQQSLYPNQVDTDRRDLKAHCGCRFPIYHRKSPGEGQASSLPSYLPSTQYQNYLGADCVFPSWHHSHPGTQSSHLNRLEQPGSLHSFLGAGFSIHTNQVRSFPGLHCGYNGPAPLQLDRDHLNSRPGYQPPYRNKGICIPWISISGSQ